MKAEMSRCRLSMEILRGRDEFCGSKTYPSYGEKVVACFCGLKLGHIRLEGQSLELPI